METILFIRGLTGKPSPILPSLPITVERVEAVDMVDFD
jgi:hypothetical protein